MALLDSFISFDDYLKLREDNNDIIEYLNGIVCMSPSPSTIHQRISRKLTTELDIYLRNTKCEVFTAPYDIELSKEGIDGKRIIIPDLSVICNKNGLTNNKYIGVPSLIIEILSPSNQSHDLVTKLNIYMKYGVKEYWIINPMKSIVMIYTLDDNGNYEQWDIKGNKEVISSKLFDSFKVDLSYIFND